MGLLNMNGMIDTVFRSTSATSVTTGGSYVDGVWVPGDSQRVTFNNVNIQPLNNKEIQFLQIGAERISNVMKLYINDARAANIDLWCNWEIDGIVYKTIQLDNRPWRTYCKLMVERVDDQ
ncbi:hypothetical protein X848_gp24 [Edwardsiella phage PEi21]|uniref:Uncharacterized protein n=1 Tax=Edwardsiella phage PEi21 TaxID=1325372 RepID=N0DQQ1_9CAUD|nr:hypothetical protein X848_gp24 [Edwardsiella phage PEi21]QXV72913.1 hypothetical protein [Edwardsiella phage PVN06]BAN16834.1 hypothetical protein [Edwardsiella phage PEi21]